MEKYICHMYYNLIRAYKTSKMYDFFLEGLMSLNPFYEDKVLWQLVSRSEMDAMAEDWNNTGRDMYCSFKKIAKDYEKTNH